MQSTSPSRGRLLAILLAVPLLFLNQGWLVAANTNTDPQEPTAGVDAGDLWRLVRHKPEPATSDDEDTQEHPFFAVAPTISSKPSTGLAAGVSTNVAFVGGNPEVTHFSSASAGFRISQKNQALGGLRFGVFTGGDRWFLQGDTRLWHTSLGTFALGPAASTSGSASLKYNFYRLYETTFHQLGHHLFVGAGINISDHSNIHSNGTPTVVFQQSAFAAYSVAHSFATNRQVSSGTNVGVLYDTRDNPISAAKGTYASATYRTFFDGFAGGQSTWQELYLDARTYRSLSATGRQKLAFWFVGDLVTGGTTPFLDLPYTSSDGRSARGYGEGQFRGPHLLYGEVEYRATLVPSGLVGAVAFFNTTTVDGNGTSLLRSFEPAGGGGLRFLLNKHSRTNLCVDYGVGTRGSRGLYLGIQEAF